MFSVPSGAYGAGLEHAIQHEDSWTDDTKISDVYFNRMSHLFGQGYWGLRANAADRDLSPMLLKGAFRDAKAVIHSRSSNVYGAIDSDDFYQYLGGTAMAVRSVNGQPAETLVADLSNPKSGENVTLDRYLGQEMKARYLNPKWIDSMLNEGYAGARMMRQVTDNLWGWQVTVPEAIDANKWHEMYEVYVKDRYGLKIRERIESAENLAAYDQMLGRMQSVIKKGYWSPDESVSRTLDQVRQELQPQVQSEHHRIAQRASETSTPDAAPATPATDINMPLNEASSLPLISGFAVEEVAMEGAALSATARWDQLMWLTVISLALIAIGWKIEDRSNWLSKK
jgi:cobaltochelatase CobN